MDEKSPLKAGKYVLGLHRGPLPADGAALEHIETTNTISLEKVQRTRTENFRRHWARFWCCYMFFGIINLAIILPILFLVIIPAVAQLVVNKSSLVLTNAEVLAPRPDAVTLTVSSALKLPLALPVKTSPIALQLFNRGAGGNDTYAILYLAGALVSGNTTLTVKDQDTPLNLPQWQTFVHNVVFNAHQPLSVYGQANAYLGKLKSHVVLNKDVPTNSLNKFAGFAIQDSQLLLPADPDGTNLVANAMLPNPSVMTLEIGDTVLDLYSGDLLIGNATIPNLVLKPGNHTAPVRGILDIKTLISNLQQVLEDQKDALREGYLNLKSIGSTVTYNGQYIPYYSEVMKQLTLNAQVPLGGLLVNTLKGVFDKNGTNEIANLNITKPAGDMSPQVSAIADKLGGGGGGKSSILDSLKGTELGKKLNSRDLGDAWDDRETRSAMIDALVKLL